MSLNATLRAAAEAGVTVRFADLGAWPLLAEYDPATRTVAVAAGVVDALRASRGVAFAENFAVFAIEHELYHVRSGSRDEAAAHAYAAARTGLEVRCFEDAVRSLRR